MNKKLYPLSMLVCLCILISNFCLAQPANDNCSGATLLTTSPYSESGGSYVSVSTTGATASTPNPSCITNSDNNDDVWFRFVAQTQTALLRIHSAVSGTAAYIPFGYALYDGCGGTQIACNNEVATFFGNELLGGLTVGNTYYLRIWSRNNFTFMNFSISVQDINPTVPGNDSAAATPVSVNSGGASCISPQFFTTAGATRTSPDPSCDSDNDDDVWFKFTQPANAVFIYTEEGALISSGGFLNIGFEIIDSATATSVSCTNNFGIGSSTLFGGSAGTVYYLRIWTTGITENGVFSLCIQDGLTVPANDVCGNAQALTVANSACGNPVTGNLFNSTITSGLTNNPSCATPNAALTNDVWYSVTIPASGNVVIQSSATHTGVNDLVMQAYSGACGSLSEIACDEDGNPGAWPSANHSRINITGRTPGEVVFVRMVPRNTVNQGEFSICAFDETTLPVVLQSFTGSLNSNAVNLAWQISSSYNFKNFVVEKSADALTFTELETIEAQNTSGAMYHTIDKYPYSGNSYYRLKMIDLDGKYSYSSVINMHTKKVAIALTKFYPNPAGSVIHLEMLSDKSYHTRLNILTAAGIKILSKPLFLKPGTNNYDVSLHMAAGTYILEVKDEKEAISVHHNFIKR